MKIKDSHLESRERGLEGVDPVVGGLPAAHVDVDVDGVGAGAAVAVDAAAALVPLDVGVRLAEHGQVGVLAEEDVRLEQVLVERIHPRADPREL